MELFRRILPLAVAAAFSPTYLVIAALIVSTRDGRSRLVSYVLGWMLAIITLGLVFGSLTRLPGSGSGDL
ncbi:MAG: hypothetical protein HY876_02175, partial [Coriobacteriales bacterium]|nr:hypothetical protein [Coriobacteriales bacterium]